MLVFAELLLFSMMSYNLRERVARDYAAMHEGQEKEEEEFHDSFQYQPPLEQAMPSASQDHASSTPLSGKLANVGTSASASAPKDEVAALTAAIARAKADNEALECETEVSRLKAELHALRQRHAQLQKQNKQSTPREPHLNIKALRSNPTLNKQVSEELECLRFSSSDSEDDEHNPTTRSAQGKARLKSGKTTKLTSRVVILNYGATVS